MEIEYKTRFKESVKNKCKIFIDAANLENSVKDMYVLPKDMPGELKKYKPEELSWHVDYKCLKKFFQNNCELQDIAFYSPDFSTASHFNFLWFLKKGLNFLLNTKPLKEYDDHSEEKPHRKANFDAEIAVDAVNLIDNYDTMILFSGDCDFEYLIKFLRGKGKRAVVFSKSGHVSNELVSASNDYFDIVDFRHEILKIQKKNGKQKIQH